MYHTLYFSTAFPSLSPSLLPPSLFPYYSSPFSLPSPPLLFSLLSNKFPPQTNLFPITPYATRVAEESELVDSQCRVVGRAQAHTHPGSGWVWLFYCTVQYSTVLYQFNTTTTIYDYTTTLPRYVPRYSLPRGWAAANPQSLAARSSLSYVPSEPSISSLRLSTGTSTRPHWSCPGLDAVLARVDGCGWLEIFPVGECSSVEVVLDTATGILLALAFVDDDFFIGTICTLTHPSLLFW